MASVAHFRSDAENIISEIEIRLQAAEENAVKNFVCARTIQQKFRGYITRKHIKLLHQSACCIQKNWRAFTNRIVYRALLKEKFDTMCWEYYCAMATLIQKCWRGKKTRSQVFSYYRLKAWLGFVMQQNELLKSSVEISRNNNNIAEMKQREDEAKEWIVYILFKLHHLLRTHQLSGIYSLPNTRELSDIEKMIKSLKYKDFMIFYNAYMEDVRQAKVKEMPPTILPQCKYLVHPKGKNSEKKLHQKFLFPRESYKSLLAPQSMEMKDRKNYDSPTKTEPDDINFCCKCDNKI